ncbi:probable polygalacturonase [Gastrolobium bilobum]|uniref:probable polygalacturonase n=1 Tax=Gastrolobium bilobum TaxID=150636 RepID=UPI002AB0219C|nr:probable polygalacturonase [Gastrolobium bilobum]
MDVLLLLLALALMVALPSMTLVESRKSPVMDYFEYRAMSCRGYSASLTEFGGVGDGTTLNTKAFQTAIDYLSRYTSNGGSQLYVPPGRWLTGSFNLTSHFTLFLHKDAVILGSQDESEWPVIDPLPSYGRGRDTQGGRFSSLIFGTNLTDVVITGDNGTIDGQGDLWWQKFHNGQLNYTRPYLIEIMYSDNVQISNLTLVNSPSWNVHPVYSSNVIVQGITILAPVTSPNTDGINPDSCTNTRIEDCYIVSGDDCVAVKSGWDEYGVRIKTGVGRGGYVKDIYVRRMTMKTMKWAFWMTGNYGSHADNNYDPNALPVIQNINYRDMVAENVTMAALLEGLSSAPFTGICISNVTIELAKMAKKVPWTCTDVAGISSDVTPVPCDLLLQDQGVKNNGACTFPEDSLPIEDVKVQTCTYRRNV